MRVTYDRDASAMYIYLAGVGPGGVKRTQYRERIGVDVDTAGQIVALRLCESDDLQLRGRLRHALLHAEVSFDEASRCLRIAFSPTGEMTSTIPWDANVDLDKDGHMTGIEILFASSEEEMSLPSDLAQLSIGVARLRAHDKLRHIEKYLVGFEEAANADSDWANQNVERQG